MAATSVLTSERRSDPSDIESSPSALCVWLIANYHAQSLSLEKGNSREDSIIASTSSKTEVPAGNGDEYNMSIVYDGELYRGMIYYMQLALDMEYVGKTSGITDRPTKELECTMGEVGQNVYVFEYNGRTCLLVEREKDDLEEGCVFGAVVGLKAGEVSEIIKKQ